MESDVLLVLLGIAATLIVGLLGFVGVLVRRNGRNSPHNPNVETLAVLAQEQLKAAQASDKKLDHILMALTEMRTVIEFCPTVQGRRGG